MAGHLEIITGSRQCLSAQYALAWCHQPLPRPALMLLDGYIHTRWQSGCDQPAGERDGLLIGQPQSAMKAMQTLGGGQMTHAALIRIGMVPDSGLGGR